VLDVQPRDRYGRLLAYVWVGQQFINAELVRQGYAEAATYPPNVRYYATFIELQRQARLAALGLWGDPEAVAAYRVRASGVIGVKNTKVFLHPDDPHVKLRGASEYVYFESPDEARAAGYTHSIDYFRQAHRERTRRLQVDPHPTSAGAHPRPARLAPRARGFRPQHPAAPDRGQAAMFLSTATLAAMAPSSRLTRGARLGGDGVSLCPGKEEDGMRRVIWLLCGLLPGSGSLHWAKPGATAADFQ